MNTFIFAPMRMFALRWGASAARTTRRLRPALRLGGGLLRSNPGYRGQPVESRIGLKKGFGETRVNS